MDIDSVPLGVDFQEWLNKSVAKASVVLALIGRGWVDARDEHGLRRLENPNEFVRIEIEAALARKITVIPLLIDGAPFPRVEDLPASLQPLTRRNAAFLDAGRDFNVHIARLIAAVEPCLKLRKGERSEESFGQSDASNMGARLNGIGSARRSLQSKTLRSFRLILSSTPKASRFGPPRGANV